MKKFWFFYLLFLVALAYFFVYEINYITSFNPESDEKQIILMPSQKPPSLFIIKGNGDGSYPVPVKTQGKITINTRGLPYFITENGFLYLIGVKNNDLSKYYQLNIKPAGAVFTKTNKLYVADSESPYIYKYRLGDKNFAEKIFVCNPQNFVFLNSRGTNLISCEEKTGIINIFSVKTHKLIKSVPLREKVKKMLFAPASNKIYILTKNKNFMILNLDIYVVEKKIKTGKNITDFAVTWGKYFQEQILALDYTANKLYVFKNGHLVREKKLAFPEPSLISVSPQCFYAFIYYAGTGDVEKINLKTFRFSKYRKITPSKISQLVVL